MFLIVASFIVISLSILFDKVMDNLVKSNKISVDTYKYSTQMVDLFSFILVSTLVLMAIFAPL